MSDSSLSGSAEGEIPALLDTFETDCYEVGFQDGEDNSSAADIARDQREHSRAALHQAYLVLQRRIDELTPSRVSPSATAEMEHPEATCQRCGRENIESWHAPSPLWNAVMRNEETGDDLYSVVCPICFAEMATTVIGPVVWCIKPHGMEVRGLWADADARQWDPEQCLWVATLDTPRSPSSPAPSATCPCTIIEPCSDVCSCAKGHMSGGCLRCATYGSREQQIASAHRIAQALASRAPSRGSEEELGKLLDAWKEQIILGEDSYDEHEDYDRWLRRETAARSAVESYVSRLRDERDRLERFETYVCQVIAMGNQADLTVESLPR